MDFAFGVVDAAGESGADEVTDGDDGSSTGVVASVSSGASGKDSEGEPVALGATEVGEGFGVFGCLGEGVDVVFGAVGRTFFVGVGVFVGFRVEVAVGFVVGVTGFFVPVVELGAGFVVGDVFFAGVVGCEDVRLGEGATPAVVDSRGAGRVGKGSNVEVRGGEVFVTRAR